MLVSLYGWWLSCNSKGFLCVYGGIFFAVYNTCQWLVSVVEQSADVPDLWRTIVEPEPFVDSRSDKCKCNERRILKLVKLKRPDMT